MITIVLVEPEHEGNVGAIARSMKNFGLSTLILINPQCEINETLRNRAKHAQDVVDNIKIINSFNDIPKTDILIGTTAQLGTDYNITRTPVSIDHISEKVDSSQEITIIFGREGNGLTNEEVEKCNILITIPAHKKYPVLNLSHAANLVFYELFKQKISCNEDEKHTAHLTPISQIEIKQLTSLYTQALDKLKFSTETKRETQQKLWRKIVGKAGLTKRESFILMGFFRKIIQEDEERLDNHSEEE